MKWLITGDTHGVFTRFKSLDKKIGEEFAVIIVGDAGINYCLDERDYQFKKFLSKYNCVFYCVRGNHEERPENCNIPLIWDVNVMGEVYCEKEFPYIRYFKDGGTYMIDGKKVLTIGGAYSIDKEYRLIHGSRWFESEQLTAEEKEKILEKVRGQHFDAVLSHTCPLDWEPRDLFLSFIDQTTVDKRMEIFLNVIKNHITFDNWYFGHYHADRWEREGVRQLYEEIIEF